MISFTNSPLINLTNLSPHRNSPRNQPIRKITIHHFAGNATIEAVSNFLAQPGRNASYNYGIGSDGRKVLIVEERNRCWGSSSPANDHQAVVIGVANNRLAPDWAVSDKAFEALIDLCVCICERNPGIVQIELTPGLWYDGTVNGNLTRHNFFSNTLCPGPHLQSRFPEIVRRVNERLCRAQLAANSPLHVDNVGRMVKLGVINSPEFWLEVDSVQWLNELLEIAGQDGVLDRRVDNGISDLDTALKVLEMAGVMNSPDYWRGQVKNSGVRFLGQLIINIANRSLDPLHRIVWAEARGEDLKGQTLVANVVLNRHNSAQFPNGIYNVIHQPGQFEPTRNGSYARAIPLPKNKQAVNEALSGVDYSRGALFFDSAADSWARQNRTLLFRHGAHTFFA